jgi:ATP-dependent RNA helicase DHX29
MLVSLEYRISRRALSYTVQSQREKLPIARFRDEIVQKLETSQVLVLSGETGWSVLSENSDISMTGLFDSGKSTQVPAFILEDQLSRGKACKVYCAEPRRISAISLAQRVSLELGDSPGAVGTPASLVGYSIRLENNISRNTRLAYITYGIAIRMLEGGKQSEGGVTFDEITVGRIHLTSGLVFSPDKILLTFSTSSSMRYCVVSHFIYFLQSLME